MGNIIQLATNGTKPLRGGYDFFWSAILDVTTPESPLFTFKDIDGKCDFGHEDLLVKFLRKLVANGIIEIAVEKTLRGRSHTYRLLRRQRDTPSFSARSGYRKGQAQQQMWNVMRRARQGFTIADLALDASTDDLVIASQTAKDYCAVLHRAGVLDKLRQRTGGKSANIYVLRGSANTGPKAPRRYRTTLLFDQNTGLVLGNSIAEEIAP